MTAERGLARLAAKDGPGDRVLLGEVTQASPLRVRLQGATDDVPISSTTVGVTPVVPDQVMVFFFADVGAYVCVGVVTNP